MTRRLVALANRGVRYALSMIRRYYERGASQDRRMFHRRPHTLDVLRRATALAAAMGLWEREVQLVRISAAFHDTEVAFPGDPANRTSNNELNSAYLMQFWLRFNDHAKLIADHEKLLMTKAIMVTFPGFDHERRTVFQPKLKVDSHPIVRCVALADLGTAGMGGGTLFLKESDLRFREKNVDIDHHIAAATCRSYVSAQLQQDYSGRMRQWLYSQPNFVAGRQARLDLELGNLPAAARERVRALFCRFDDSLQALHAAIARRSGSDFWALAGDMGYEIPPA